MKIFFSIAFLLLSIFALSQDSTIEILKTEAIRPITISIPDSIKKDWIKGGLFNLNVAQGSLKNWAAGGDDFSLSFTLYTNGHAFYKKGKVTWENNVDFNLGYINTTSLGSRKNDDRFDFYSKYGYGVSKTVSASALFDLRTQFFDGYTYPDGIHPLFASTSFSPAYVLLSPGFDIRPIKNLSIFLSPITSRWTVVMNPTLSKIGAYGVDSGKHAMDQVGAFGTIMLNSKVNKLITYTGRLDLFSNYEHNAQDVDLYMTNLFAAKLGKIITATWDIDMIYDDDVRIFGPNHNSPRLQLKSMIGVGILIKVGT
ncbi:MAG TPA: DUF3078 domain-containing protein [Parafilimonas sp.]|nr:DUF3078 domain-containing protein [Parafilimonas sp.]